MANCQKLSLAVGLTEFGKKLLIDTIDYLANDPSIYKTEKCEKSSRTRFLADVMLKWIASYTEWFRTASVKSVFTERDVAVH